MLKKALLSGIMAALVSLCFSAAFAQWPADPEANMVICERNGEQAIPLVASTSDGGCYICWYDNSSGNYDVYLQRLNADGEIQWQQNGLLISDHPQDTWLTDYDMAVDQQNNAIIVFNDIRDGGDWDIYAYLISPEGDFLWGNDGLVISDNDAFEAIPVVTVTTDGNFVIAWLEDDIIHLRKLTPEGQDYWHAPYVINMASQYGMSNPQMVSVDNDGFILQAMVKSGPNYWDSYDIYMYKFDAYGDTLWGGDGVVVSNGGGLAFYMIPYLVPDGFGGAFSYWYDSRIMNELHTYAQHINADGEAVWQENGVQVSLAPAQFQMNPSLIHFPESENVMVFYKTSNTNQSQFGIGGQLISGLGQRLWDDDGATILPITNQGRDFAKAHIFENDALVIFFDSPPGDVVHSFIEAVRINVDGQPVWEDSPKIISAYLSEKLHLETAASINNQILAVWEDRRNGAADIYLQNVNPDGTLGPYITAIDENDAGLPEAFGIVNAYPNPFNASTNISFNLKSSGKVKLEVFDILGRSVETLVDNNLIAGNHQVTWNAGQFTSGMYFVRLQADDEVQSQKLLLLK